MSSSLLMRGPARRALALSLAAAAVAGVAGAATGCTGASSNPRVIAQRMLAQRGWSSQWACLEALWTRESGWNVHARNASSGAYGIPQALPASKMAASGPDRVNNPATQIAWGLGYIGARYGGPCGAWNHSQATGWY
ncbi:MAG: aggregation-promoting factor C-terminal-like domain-containing protein [Frankiaceae bacterium]